jgi:hypothetical protein
MGKTGIFGEKWVINKALMEKWVIKKAPYIFGVGAFKFKYI